MLKLIKYIRKITLLQVYRKLLVLREDFRIKTYDVKDGNEKLKIEYKYFGINTCMNLIKEELEEFYKEGETIK